MGSNKQGARRGFTAEFKAEAVRLLAQRRAAGATASQVGRELDVRPDQLRAWARLQHEAAGAGAAVAGETLEQENRRLRREVITLRQESARKPVDICGAASHDAASLACAAVEGPSR